MQGIIDFFKMIIAAFVDNFSAIFGLFTLLFHIFFIFPKVTKKVIAIAKRRNFIKKLRLNCENKNYTLSKIDKPYKSLFKSYEGEYNFELTIDKKTYACKLIHAKHRLRPMTFCEDGYALITKVYRLWGVELGRKNKKQKYSFEAEGKEKILIVNPVPKELFVNENGRNTLIDNGQKIWDYRVYTVTAFINAIDRGIINR